jgi:hypothetical protein
MANKKNTKSRSETRSLRIQQIIFITIALIVILSMLMSLMIK